MRTKDVAPQGRRSGHLGLTEPQALDRPRWAGVRPPCVGDERGGGVQWIDVYVETLDGGRAGVHLQAF
ncbi:hypothetical protein [Streptomyces sp. NPDC054842]